ncbi:MAG: hypothetical protein K2W96_24320, partial [Gemmataceae bacterium]|nr:hypothetical protein [Gemmataceae bacterium]
SSSHMRLAGMAALAASPFLRGLQALDVSGGRAGDAVAEGVASSGWRHLVSLDASRNGMTAAGIARLARWDGASRLESLALSEPLGDDAAAAFASGEWPALRRLTLHLGGITAAGLEALWRCRSLAGLRELDLPLEASQLRAVASAPALAGLRKIVVYGACDEDGLRVLAGSALLRSLRSLTLGWSDPAGLEAVLASSTGLRHLSIVGADGQAVVSALHAAGHLSGLRSLALTFMGLAAPDVRLIARSPHLSGLAELDLAGCRLTEESARELIASPHLGRSLKLALTHQPAPADGAVVEALRERFGTVTV